MQMIIMIEIILNDEQGGILAASEPAMRSSHPCQPGEAAPLLREGPRQVVDVEVTALRQSARQGGGKGEHKHSPHFISPPTDPMLQ